MKKKDFILALEDYLELSDLNETSALELTSLGILSVIALVDENFDKQLKAADLRSVNSVGTLIKLIGTDNFSD